ncbi:hypothetical protein BJX63DRAFT_438688 [Aspergillus granulosus]|uniref:Zn(2)-C6 fungal-type domain-containing protein n=1 Tax=Aspergillus granulosus TaxID=176169 RepID=A0ABR4GR78_9EURO
MARRKAHNVIEKRYRENLNSKFAALERAMCGDTSLLVPLRKSNILANAVLYMEEMQTKNNKLERELKIMRAPKGRPVLKPFSGGIPRRRKLTTACEKCRSLRKRCDGEKPCGSCRGLHVQCKYSESDGRKKEEWKARVEALEQRNHYLEQQIKHLKCNQAPEQETPEQELSLHESSFASAERRSTFSTTSAVQPYQADYGIEQMFYTATANHPLLGSLNTLYGHSDCSMRSQLPDEHITRYALDAFFQCAATLFYVITEENAAQLLRKVYHTINASIQDVRENIPRREDFMDFKEFTNCLIQYHMTKLALIASEIQNEIVLCQQDYWNHADPLSKKLDLWYQELPLELHLAALGKLEGERTVTILQKRGAYMMHMLYIDSRLQLCCQLLNAAQASQSNSVPFFLESLLNQVPGHFCDMHTGFAIQLSKILSLIFTNQAIMTRCWLVMRSAFDTCIVLFLGLCHKYFKASENWNISEIFSHVDSCFQVLCFCASHDVAAKRLRDLVDPVHEHLSHMSPSPRPVFGPESGLQQCSERDTNKMTIPYMLDSKASDALTLVRMTHHLLKFMPPHKWDIWI